MNTPHQPQHPEPAPGYGRIPFCGVFPVIENGAYPAKAVVDEELPIRATIFREGHDALRAVVVMRSPQGHQHEVELEQIEPWGLDLWEAWVRPDQEGDWSFHIEAWSSPWRTWRHAAAVKFPIGQDVELVCAEGQELLQSAADAARTAGQPTDARALGGFAALLDCRRPLGELAGLVTDPSLDRLARRWAPRPLLTAGRQFPLRVERRRALFSSWYEFFPRSEGAHQDPITGSWVSGSLDDCHAQLDRVAALGFDVVYLPPIHPVGRAFRKGRNNTLDFAPDDPGSPWAIGSAEGGHDAVHPDLGGLAAFDRFVSKARAVGLEVALDFALQVSPEHPWVIDHPEWFTTRIDGSIAYAENPPKKYQDIYPLNFDKDPEGIYAECLRILEFWIARGVTLFRVDNPHTKPLVFWAWLLERLHRDHPEVILLAEAFTRPAMMQALGQVGFQQSYTYFTWRTSQQELASYLIELSAGTAHQLRPNFFVNTPDINPAFLQSGLPAAFAIRAVLAATMSPSWGVYSGFELFEHAPLRPGREEYLHSEKYEYRPRDYTREPNLNQLIGRLNEIRRGHPALQQLRRSSVLTCSDERLIAFTRTDGADIIIVVCSLDPAATVEASVELGDDLLAGRPKGVLVHDELTGADFCWGASNYVRLDPAQPAHILSVR